jgi:transcriptional regulator with XRE-family HTH domain
MGASKKLTVAEYLSSLIDLSDKTQAEIAKEANLGRPNVVSMLKNGTTKVPLHKAPGLAKVAEALEEAGIEPVSQNERDILNTIREASNETDPGLNQDRRDALFSAFGGN